MGFRTFLSACYKTEKRLRLKICIFIYNRHLKRLVPEIFSHRPFRIMFYVNNLSMWKSDKLLMLLKNDARFEPFIVSYIYSSNSLKGRYEREQELMSHFNALGINCYSGYDYQKNQLLPVSKFNADLVFYPQPYINRLKDIPRGVLLSYIPYCYEMEDQSKFFYNSLYQNICWKIFVPSSLHRELKTKYNINKGTNVVVAGNPLVDYFFDGHTPSDVIWPSKNPQLKKIIWAPHHSIRSVDMLDYSNFLEIADEMQEIAKKYSDKAQFVFKPHPMLKEKLYKIDSWGVERTDKYYAGWETMPNCSFVNGNYVDLFMTSDALIHDCSSFTAEYLYVNKPVMFLSKKKRIPQFNVFADACFNVHYHGASSTDIEAFIDNVINGVDPMLEERTKFVNAQLVPQGNETVAGTIYKELCKIFE